MDETRTRYEYILDTLHACLMEWVKGGAHGKPITHTTNIEGGTITVTLTITPTKESMERARAEVQELLGSNS